LLDEPLKFRPKKHVKLKVIEIVGILKVFLFAALDQMTIHGAEVIDFLFIQLFGWILIIIAWGRKSQKNPSDLHYPRPPRGTQKIKENIK
jgi:hypothetical protein